MAARSEIDGSRISGQAARGGYIGDDGAAAHSDLQRHSAREAAVKLQTATSELQGVVGGRAIKTKAGSSQPATRLGFLGAIKDGFAAASRALSIRARINWICERINQGDDGAIDELSDLIEHNPYNFKTYQIQIMIELGIARPHAIDCLIRLYERINSASRQTGGVQESEVIIDGLVRIAADIGNAKSKRRAINFLLTRGMIFRKALSDDWLDMLESAASDDKRIVRLFAGLDKAAALTLPNDNKDRRPGMAMRLLRILDATENDEVRRAAKVALLGWNTLRLFEYAAPEECIEFINRAREIAMNRGDAMPPIDIIKISASMSIAQRDSDVQRVAANVVRQFLPRALGQNPPQQQIHYILDRISRAARESTEMENVLREFAKDDGSDSGGAAGTPAADGTPSVPTGGISIHGASQISSFGFALSAEELLATWQAGLTKDIPPFSRHDMIVSGGMVPGAASAVTMSPAMNTGR